MLKVYLIQASDKEGNLVYEGRDFVVPAFNKKEAIDIFNKLKSIYDIYSIRSGNKKEIAKYWDLEQLYMKQIIAIKEMGEKENE